MNKGRKDNELFDCMREADMLFRLLASTDPFINISKLGKGECLSRVEFKEVTLHNGDTLEIEHVVTMEI